ncbi:unnamed protein product [Sphagnum jensenii]
MPSALKPPRPPSRNKTVQMVSTTRNESCLRAQKEDKGWRMCNVERAVHLVPVALLACLLILYICSCAQFREYEMMGGEMSQNAIETTMMTERHLQQALSSKSPAEEQIYSTYALEKMNTDLQFDPSDLPITQSMLRGVAS